MWNGAMTPAEIVAAFHEALDAVDVPEPVTGEGQKRNDVSTAGSTSPTPGRRRVCRSPIRV